MTDETSESNGESTENNANDVEASPDGGDVESVGEPSPAPTTNEPSITDLAQQPVVKAWTKFVAAQFALIGIGLGLGMILLDIVDEGMFEGMGGITMGTPPEQAMFWILALAPLVGIYVGWKLRIDDKTAFLVAGISTFVGTIALLILSAILTSIAIDGLSVDFGGLLITSITTGITVGIVAAGAVWITRNHAPDETGSGRNTI